MLSGHTLEVNFSGFCRLCVTDFLNDRAWVMSDHELEVWDVTLRKAFSMASASGTNSTAVVRRMLQRINGDIAKCVSRFCFVLALTQAFRFISSPKAVAILLSYVDLSGVDALPVDVFSMVDTVLVSTYPPPPESLAACLKILCLIGQIISDTPVSMLIQLLTTTEESLRRWIGDKDGVMLESEFNSVVGFRDILQDA
jgi:hypothetical protein